VKQIFDIVQSFVMMALVLAGILGLIYRTVKEEGWFGTVVDKTWNAIVDHPLVTIPLLIAAAVIGKLWHGHQVEKGYTSKLPNFFLYGVMAAGVYFIWHFISTGTI
jgi:hypothetical protein